MNEQKEYCVTYIDHEDQFRTTIVKSSTESGVPFELKRQRKRKPDFTKILKVQEL